MKARGFLGIIFTVCIFLGVLVLVAMFNHWMAESMKTSKSAVTAASVPEALGQRQAEVNPYGSNIFINPSSDPLRPRNKNFRSLPVAREDVTKDTDESAKNSHILNQ